MIASASIAYTTGMVAANFEWLAWPFLMLLAMLFVPYYLSTGVSTMPQFMKRRFGEGAYRFLAWYALFTTVILWLGGTLYASGKLLSQIMGWEVSLCIVVLTLIATSFTVAGGLAAVVITDSFQAILMILGAAVLTVIGLVEVGSAENLFGNVPADYWKLVRPAHDADFPWHAMFLGYPVLGIWFWCTDQTIVQRVLGARDVRQGQLGAVFAGFLKVLTPLIFYVPGVLCFVLHPDLEDPDAAFMTMVSNYLWPGMIGLIVAVLIAAVISTIDSGLNSFSTVFTLDIYVRNFRPAASPWEIKWLGRVATVAAALIAVGCAISMQGVGRNLFDLLQGIIAFVAPPMAAVFTIGVLWRRATGKAAVAALLIGTAVSLSVGFCHFKEWPEPESAVLKLTGPAPVEGFQRALRTVTYENKAEEPDTTPRIVTAVAHHDGASREVARAVIDVRQQPVVVFQFEKVMIGGIAGDELASLAVTIENLQDGSAEILDVDTMSTALAADYDNRFWPHYLLLSFYLFVAIAALMIGASLATRKSPQEEPLPTLKETYAALGRSPAMVWALWGVLAGIMLSVYVGFQLLAYLLRVGELSL
jgi:SSS family solute:Na+ symporter